ncbi:MAG: bifunctional [glutamine synthetase] adenylyltransferase/[glutamine synthetase]-adenylyl-L-tyrosine phosphorylase [Methylobacterium sp.]|uniref:bifunctional [glutamine synthetase] adenylyltransferase/[glutamine synthetase]-adenylyl-L-tyrosine phosphorylase n=1 Tax=Methylobacterium sp. TaxID=409 RepID=UPI0025E45CA3|nr:bifunctional [glutamine synthetase] adenylyltransferase/[glutamine synthetase]-adenylyl-L-tyrosine phosphorylase [Methylobacterium sp.]MBX9932930.1 bifunctional [glutamine synthetase] adenylyltransferase/[glutamine synthetase]-adenylyl-L-tyrosine phosphorylase [Methylobacterium sp.]
MSLSLRDGIAAAPVLKDRGTALSRLAEIEPVLPPGLSSPALKGLLLGLAEHSPFLWQTILRDPQRLVGLCERPPEASHRAICKAQRNSGRQVGQNLDDVGTVLRRNRTEHALLVAMADIGGIWPMETVTSALSEFADASVSAAADALLLQAAETGRYRPADSENPQLGSGLIILGLGKLGARELNYSSDIDLVVFFDPEVAPLKDGVEPTPFFAKLAQGIAKLLQERTAEGYVHRVDYRLRPDPGSTSTAISIASAFVYYETLGQNWERAAFIKARPIAGDIAAGDRFLADLTPFVWRKYFDFASIADVHAMKRQIHAVRGHDAIAVAGHDIKLGRGGIREIEFFVQTQQLVFGGRRPTLRGRETMAMLAALTEEGWIDAAARDELGEAYRFLRTIEHRLQMLRDEQTQRLPVDAKELTAFAHFAGFPTKRAFEAALLHHARRVQAHYAMLFEAEPDLSADTGSLVFSGVDDDPATLKTLQSLGFREPGKATETVRGWHFGRRPAIRTARAREVLTELLPSLMKALGSTAEPDAALDALDRAFGRMPAALELLTILRSNERLRQLFADLLGSAPRLAETVAFSPHVLDAVIDPGFVDVGEDAAGLARQFVELLGRPKDHEDFLDRSRDAARQMRFVNGARLISGFLTPERAGRAYASIADAVIAGSLDAVSQVFEAEHGTIPRGRIAVIGLGRLGSRQLTAESDLDLMVIYDFDPDARRSTGPRSLDAAVAYNRLTQRLVAALTAPTRRGTLYEVDLRLRPGGGQGAIATQLHSFLAYQADEAELWEHMALTRARPIAGDPGLGREVAEAIEATIRRPREPANVNKAVREMRDLVEREKPPRGPLDLKLSPGGLLDLDFLAQALVLGQAAAFPELARMTGAELFARAGALGLLITHEADKLADAYRFLDTVHQWQRLMIQGEPTSASPVILARLAAAMGLPDARSLSSQLAAERAEVRRLFKRLL